MRSAFGYVVGLATGVVIAIVVCLALVQPPAAEAHGTIAPRLPYHHNWIRVGPGCETYGRAHPWQTNTGNGYYGGLQFSKSTWDSVNRSSYAYPHRAPAWVQIANANKLKAREGLSPWPRCGSRF